MVEIRKGLKIVGIGGSLDCCYKDDKGKEVVIYKGYPYENKEEEYNAIVKRMGE